MSVFKILLITSAFILSVPFRAFPSPNHFPLFLYTLLCNLNVFCPLESDWICCVLTILDTEFVLCLPVRFLRDAGQYLQYGIPNSHQWTPHPLPRRIVEAIRDQWQGVWDLSHVTRDGGYDIEPYPDSVIDLTHICGRGRCINLENRHIVIGDHKRNMAQIKHHNKCDDLYAEENNNRRKKEQEEWQKMEIAVINTEERKAKLY